MTTLFRFLPLFLSVTLTFPPTPTSGRASGRTSALPKIPPSLEEPPPLCLARAFPQKTGTPIPHFFMIETAAPAENSLTASTLTHAQKLRARGPPGKTLGKADGSTHAFAPAAPSDEPPSENACGQHAPSRPRDVQSATLSSSCQAKATGRARFMNGGPCADGAPKLRPGAAPGQPAPFPRP